MNPYWTQLARRNWQVLVALALFSGFTIVHATAFRPQLERYRRATAQAARLGIPLDAGAPVATPSARVAALLAGNSLIPAVAEEQAASGALGARLMGEVTGLAAKRGLEVLSTEQGLVTQLPGSVVVRAHFRFGGSYARFVGLLDDFARSGSFLALERFKLGEGATQGGNIEIWVSQLVLKRTGASR